MLRLLHFSDIHFNKKKGAIDKHIELRDAIELDLTQLKDEQSNPIDYILVCGDIAYSGNKPEYKKATDWLTKVSKIVDCKESNVLVVPGNHDLNRSIVNNSQHQTLLHSHIKNSDTKKADEFFEEFIENEDIHLLKRPFENFINFASQYGCVPQKNELHWDLLHNQFGNYSLCFHGCNTALLADKNDDVEPNKMFMSYQQRYIKRQKGLIYITLCHHPIECLIDEKETEHMFDHIAELQLYGHKHKYHTVSKVNSLIIHAGAVQPDESQYIPCYNIIDLDIKKKGDFDFLSVKIWTREWDGEDFKCGVNKPELFEKFEIKIKNNNGSWSQMSSDTVEKNKEELQKEIEPIDVKIEEVNEKFTERDIRFKFLTLPFLKRKNIGEQMIPGSFADSTIGEVDRSIAFLLEIKNNKLYLELWNKIK